MASRPIHGIVALGLTFACGCGGAPEGAPPPLKLASAEERVLQVGRTWSEAGQSQGFPNDSAIAFIRATDCFTLHLRAGASSAVADMRREELIRTPSGNEFHCIVAGSVQATVRFSWRVGEPAVVVQMPASTLPRTCKEGGAHPTTKRYEPLNVLYVLRGDRLVAVDPPTLRSALLPSD